VVRSNEKSCVCNVFATPYSKNPVKSSLPSYLNVNFSYQRDNFSEKRISRVYYTSELRFWGVFCVNYDKINIIIKRKQV